LGPSSVVVVVVVVLTSPSFVADAKMLEQE
jgi:hypothetical protein